jgi:hypothetical protein
MRNWHFRWTRDGALFLLGLGIIVNEAFIQRVPDPTLLLLGGSLVGLPAFLSKDAQAKQ